MTVDEKEYCPKCTTGTIIKLNRDELICQKCGKIWGAVRTLPKVFHVPRPGGNRYVR